MPEYVNLTDWIKVGIIAFLFIFAVNHILTKAGLEQFKA